MKTITLIGMMIFATLVRAEVNVGNGTTGVVCFTTAQAAKDLRMFESDGQLKGYLPIPDQYFANKLVESVEVLDLKELSEAVGNPDEIFDNSASDLIVMENQEKIDTYINRLLARFRYIIPSVETLLLDSKKNLGRFQVAMHGFPGVFDSAQFNYYGDKCNLNTIAVQFQAAEGVFWKVDNRLYEMLPMFHRATMWLHEMVLYHVLKKGVKTTDSTRKAVHILLTKSFARYPDQAREINNLYEALEDLRFLPTGESPYQRTYLNQELANLVRVVGDRIQTSLALKILEIDQEVKTRLPEWYPHWEKNEECQVKKIRESKLQLRDSKGKPYANGYIRGNLIHRSPEMDGLCLNLLKHPSTTRTTSGNAIAAEIYQKYKNFESELFKNLKTVVLPELLKQKVDDSLSHIPFAFVTEREQVKEEIEAKINEYVAQVEETLIQNLIIFDYPYNRGQSDAPALPQVVKGIYAFYSLIEPYEGLLTLKGLDQSSFILQTSNYSVLTLQK